ncbi:MAG: AhpC/TSA family protein [Calditrichaeota bacterium]|nr:MAG: AhpC/TSA family protein [Calditrichota bacterium]MBL1208024.1 AhpC/TSA family protein [Calditrichota bacterium]NOG47860.1 AhpC/TSA family protein [Calditrichota bacterium]
MRKKTKIIISIIAVILILIAIPIVLIMLHDNVKNTGLQVGDLAPHFEGIDQNGDKIILSTLIQEGPVVLFFYRGFWCPYCNAYLNQLQDSLQMIENKGANVLAITPEQEEYVKETIEKTTASFSIISDKKLEIMKSYKVDFEVTEGKAFSYNLFGMDIKETNVDGSKTLPVPATYIINTLGIIEYAHFNPDYKDRASVVEILQSLK